MELLIGPGKALGGSEWTYGEAVRELPKWSPQTQVVLGVLGRPGTLSDPLSVLCQWICERVTCLLYALSY